MPDILLSTFNAKYIHTAFGLRYLKANLGDLEASAEILEFDLKKRPHDVAEILLAQNPRIIGLGVYIWNVRETHELVGILKQARPDITLVLGGPEVSYQANEQPIVALADYVISGEADLAFADLCRKLLLGDRPSEKLLTAPLPDLKTLQFPYRLYTDEDVRQRVVYVEASRGCPFRCEFCLSSLELPVRRFELEPFLAQMQRLLDAGATQFKFVDRTFNLNIDFSQRILQFFLDRLRPGLFLHFEMIPDRLPEALKTQIAQFPQGTLQFEVGVQTLNPDIEKNISRRQNHAQMAENFRFLEKDTQVHVHADLLVGLPGETFESFARGFDDLFSLGPEEIQVGILKRLKGTPIVRHDENFKMRYNPSPPFEVLQTSTLSFGDVQRLRRFARHWDMFANSGRFRALKNLLWGHAQSPFYAFLEFSDWLFQKHGHTEGLAVVRQFESLWEFLTEVKKHPKEPTAALAWEDYARGGRSDRPPFLKPYLYLEKTEVPKPSPSAPKRQARHL